MRTNEVAWGGYMMMDLERFFKEKEIPFTQWEIEYDGQIHIIDSDFVIHTSDGGIVNGDRIIIDIYDGDANYCWVGAIIAIIDAVIDLVVTDKVQLWSIVEGLLGGYGDTAVFGTGGGDS